MYSRPGLYLCPVYSFVMLITLLDRTGTGPCLIFQKPLDPVPTTTVGPEGATKWFSGRQFSRYNLNKLMQEIAGGSAPLHLLSIAKERF